MIGEMDFCLRIGAAARSVSEQMDKVASEQGLSVGPASVLVAVATSPGKTQVDYSSALVINDATLTRYIDRLEDAELLERRRGREDRRVVRLHMTSKGDAKAKALLQGFLQLQHGFADALGEKGFDALSSEVRALALALANRGSQA